MIDLMIFLCKYKFTVVKFDNYEKSGANNNRFIIEQSLVNYLYYHLYSINFSKFYLRLFNIYYTILTYIIKLFVTFLR